MRELSIFVDESGDFGPVTKHSPFYILGLVLHDQSDDITGQLDQIHDNLVTRGMPADHAVHTAPLIRREQEYVWLDMPARRSIFRVLIDFTIKVKITHHSWVFAKKEHPDTDKLVAAISRELSAFIRENVEFFSSWDRIVIYYDSGQKELTNIVNAVFNAHFSTAEVRKVAPPDYSLFQAADLVCTLALLRAKMETVGLSRSERAFFSTQNDSAERALKKGYFKTMDRRRFGS